MKTPRIAILPILLIAGILRAQAPAETPAQPPANPTTPAQTDMQKWLFDLDAQWQAVFKRDVTDVHEEGHNKLKLAYLNSIEAAVAKASKAGDLNVAVALRNEQKRFSEANEVPALDDAGDLPVLKQIRAGWRAQMAAIESSRATRAKATHARYDQILSQAQTQLTQRERLDDALLVKSRREEVAAAWLTPATAAAATPAPSVAKTGPVPDQSKTVPMSAGSLKEKLTNTVWVWNGGERITFLPGGKARWSVNNTDTFTWRITSETKRVIEGKSPAGRAYTMTLDPSLDSGKLLEATEAERPTARLESAAAKPAIPVTKVPFGTKAGPAMAKVEVHDAPLAPFKLGESRVNGTKPVQWTEIPDQFQGYQFTRPDKSVPTLTFKVITDGLVQIACTSRFGGGGGGGDWKSEIISEDQLQKKGWKKLRGVEFKDSQDDHVWWAFTRTCRAGEQFSIRTEKYISPFLLVK